MHIIVLTLSYHHLDRIYWILIHLTYILYSYMFHDLHCFLLQILSSMS